MGPRRRILALQLGDIIKQDDAGSSDKKNVIFVFARL